MVPVHKVLRALRALKAIKVLKAIKGRRALKAKASPTKATGLIPLPINHTMLLLTMVILGLPLP